jgi:predicted ABC-type ATPase
VPLEGRERLLDPDAIARTLNPSDPAAASIAAGREVFRLTAEYFESGASFAVETTLSGRTRLELLRQAKSRGFTTHLIFVATDSPERSIQRIRSRVAKGGHFVPDHEVRRRYTRSMANAREALHLVDGAKFYDNTGDGHRLVLVVKDGVEIWRAEHGPAWIDTITRP